MLMGVGIMEAAPRSDWSVMWSPKLMKSIYIMG